MGLDVVESKDNNGTIKRRLNWSKFRQLKKGNANRNRPPFEELLLGSSFDSPRRLHDTNDRNLSSKNWNTDFQNEDYQEYDNLIDYNSAIVQSGFIPNNVNNTTLDLEDSQGASKSNKTYSKYDENIVNLPTRNTKNLSSRTPLPLFDMEHVSHRKRTNSQRHTRSISRLNLFYHLPQIINVRDHSNYGSKEEEKIRKGTKVNIKKLPNDNKKYLHFLNYKQRNQRSLAITTREQQQNRKQS